jgi:6,7-dimethyl-8-ribityllumazine synthase
MASHLHNLSSDDGIIADVTTYSFGIVVAGYHKEVTDALFGGCFKTLTANGARQDNIFIENVPGAFELPLAAQQLYEAKKPDAIICLGCVVRGETPHFDFICDAVANGIMQLNLKFSVPFILGVLTTEDILQANARSGGKHGNKGVEAALTAIKMLTRNKQL